MTYIRNLSNPATSGKDFLKNVASYLRIVAKIFQNKNMMDYHDEVFRMFKEINPTISRSSFVDTLEYLANLLSPKEISININNREVFLEINKYFSGVNELVIAGGVEAVGNYAKHEGSSCVLPIYIYLEFVNMG